MEISLKQRLIGASVLIALAVIFVPMFLDGSGQEERGASKNILLPEPEFKFEEQLPRLQEMGSTPSATPLFQPNAVANSKATTHEEEPLNMPHLAEPIPPPGESQAVNKPSAVAKMHSPIVPKPPLKPLPEPTVKPSSLGWVVQVGSFKEKGNAINLRNKLRKAGYVAFEDKGGNAKTPIYRVKVGPESKRDRALALRAKLATQQKLKGIVIQHP